MAALSVGGMLPKPGSIRRTSPLAVVQRWVREETVLELPEAVVVGKDDGVADSAFTFRYTKASEANDLRLVHE